MSVSRFGPTTIAIPMILPRGCIILQEENPLDDIIFYFIYYLAFSFSHVPHIDRYIYSTDEKILM